MLEWVAMPSSRGSSQPMDWTCISFCLLRSQVGSLPQAPPGKLKVTLVFANFSLISILPLYLECDSLGYLHWKLGVFGRTPCWWDQNFIFLLPSSFKRFVHPLGLLAFACASLYSGKKWSRTSGSTFYLSEHLLFWKFWLLLFLLP